jgi:glycine hydroxymethyltransferase
MTASGVRLGTPALTTRGMKEPEMRKIGGWIAEVLTNLEDETVIARVRREAEALTARFPLYEKRWAAAAERA